jgi:hypothetical protein
VKKPHLSQPIFLLTLALGLGLVACGGGGGESNEDEIVSVIEISVKSNDPATCKRLSTQRFMEQTESAKGAKAVKSCEEEAEETENDPKSVAVSNVEVDGEGATADVAFNGGNFDGQTLSVALVEDGGKWKLDEIKGFARLDQKHLADSVEKALESGKEPLDPQTTSCVGEALSEQSQPELEKVLFGGSRLPLVGIVEGCQREPQ